MLVSKLVVLKVSQSVLIATEEQSELHRELARPALLAHSRMLRRAQRMAAHAGATLPPNAILAARRRDDTLRTAGSGGSEPDLSCLSGATLLFPDMDSSAVSDLGELQKLCRLGVKAVITPSASNEDIFIRLKLRKFSRLRKLLNASYLSLHAIARFACSGSGLARFFSTEAHHVNGKRWETAWLPAIKSSEQRELCDQFVLLEGISQVPPLPVMHADIERGGAGRYSVWNGRVVFSPLAAGRRPFSLIPRNRWTEPFLEFVCESCSPSEEVCAADPIEANLVEQLEKAARNWRYNRVPVPVLRPGDKLVALTHCLAPGGAERQWCYLALGLKRLGYDVSVVATHDVSGAGSHYLPILHRNAIPFIPLQEAIREPPISLYQGSADDELIRSHASFAGCDLDVLTRLLLRLRPKAVFTQLDVPNILGAIAAHVAAVPRVVLSFRNYNPGHFPYIYQEWMRPCYQALSSSPRVVLTGNSRAANQDYAHWLGIPASRVHTIANAIDPNGLVAPGAEERHLLRSSLGIDVDAPVLIGIFRLSDEKRPFDFLEACRRVKEAVPQIKVLIVGEGPRQAELEATIRRLQLEACVQLLGRRTDIGSLLHVANALLLTSAREGMPNVVMEAQLAGLPVVASRTGGVPDCVTEGSTALLAEPGDIAGFSEACIRILSNPEMGRSMGICGSELMRANFTIDKMCGKYLELAGVKSAAAREERITSFSDEPAMQFPQLKPLNQELRA